MKKLLASLLAVMMLAGLVCFTSCTEATDEPDETAEDVQVAITLSGDSITSDNDQLVKIEGTTVTLTGAADYTLTGTLNDGKIIVATPEKVKVKIILNGVNVTCSDSAPLFIRACKRCVIEMAEGTENTFTDASNYQYASALETEPNAAIYSKQDLKIKGTGTLNVNANFNNGIACKDALTIEDGIINVTSVGNGIKGKDSIDILGGTITVDAKGGDAIKSNQDNDPALGYVSVEGGTLNLTASDEGIQAYTKVRILGGTVTIDAQSNGIKAETEVGVTNASVSITVADAEKAVTSPVRSGTVKVNGSDVTF